MLCFAKRCRRCWLTILSLTQDAGAGNLSPDAQEKLRALGYFGFRAAVSPESLKQGLADPKDKLWEFNSILKAEDAFQRKQDDQAEALLTEVQQKDPQIYVIPFLLGESALRRQNWERAAEQLQRCLDIESEFRQCHDRTGASPGETRPHRRSEKLAQQSAAEQPAELSGLVSDRACSMRGAIQRRPSLRMRRQLPSSLIFQPASVNWECFSFSKKTMLPRRLTWRKRSTLGLEDARLHNFLGICYNRTNRTAESSPRVSARD